MSENTLSQATPTSALTHSPGRAPQRRTWLSLTLVGLLATRHAQAQMGGGGRGKEGGAGRGATQCANNPAEPVSATLIRTYAGERLQSLPTELQLSPAQLPLYERYRQALEGLMMDESRWTARAPRESASALQSLGEQIDLASNRAAAWEAVLGAVKPLYASLDKRQQATADRRLVVSLEPSAWGLMGGTQGRTDGAPTEGQPAGSPPGR